MADTSKNKMMPRFVDLQGAYYMLPLKPPFYFEGVKTSCFQLRASLDVLQNFCDSYLNMIPEELGRFRAFMPYVTLMLMDYGRLALRQMNLGWLAQREIMFAVPVQWYRVINGQWLYQDVAYVTPFIFVDSPISLVLGRTVYGWPKLSAKADPQLRGWMHDPCSSCQSGSLKTAVYSEVYEGQKLEPQVLLTVEREPLPSLMRLPLSPPEPFTPWGMMGQAMNSMVGFMSDYTRLLEGMGIFPMGPGGSLDNLVKMGMNTAGMLNPLQPTPYFNTINLKQFRNSDEPNDFCYQALTNGKMSITSFNGGGLLGGWNELAGDSSGGFSILLNRWPSMPIIETLGLEVSEEWRGDGVNVARLKPVLPFWYDINMSYERGNTLAARHNGRWYNELGHEVKSTSEETEPNSNYNTTLGITTGTMAGPFEFQDSTIRVLPLLARKKRLREFLDGYLNHPLREGSPNGVDGPGGKSPGFKFELWCDKDVGSDSEFAYVYMVATSYADFTSKTNDVGAWSEQDLTILVPVKMLEGSDQDGWKLHSLGAVPTFTFEDNAISMISSSEVLGIPTTQATFVRPGNKWMSNDWPWQNHQTLLQVGTELLPALDLGQEAKSSVVVEIQQGVQPGLSHSAWDYVGERWGEVLRAELLRKHRLKDHFKKAVGANHLLKKARALSLEVLANDAPWNLFTLKQFRDVHDPDRACYQSLVKIPRVFKHIYDLREIEEPLEVCIRQYSSLPIIDTLGLVTKRTDDTQGGTVHRLEAVRPFWIRAAWNEGLGEQLQHYCTSSHRWELPHSHGKNRPGCPGRESFFSKEGHLRVGVDLDTYINSGRADILRSLIRKWEEEKEENHVHPLLTRKDAADILQEVGPQLIIESILSKEWENSSHDARWAVRRRELSLELAIRLQKVVPEDRVMEELRFIDEQLRELRTRPYEPAVLTALEPTFTRFTLFSGIVQVLDSYRNKLLGSERKEPGQQQAAEAISKALHIPPEHWPHPFQPAQENSILKGDPHEILKGLRKILFLEMRRKFGARLTQELAPENDTQENYARALADAATHHQELAAEGANLISRIYKQERDWLLDKLAKAAQKPDFCVLRESVGPEKERIFPRYESWDEKWYVGPAPRSLTSAKAPPQAQSVKQNQEA